MWQGKSKRRATGGKRREKRKRKKYELGREGLLCKVAGENRRKKIEARGNKEKKRLQSAGKVNLTDPESNETTVEDIEGVEENDADPHLARRNIITKGAVIRTSGGKAKVTSRPGQDGQVNAVKVVE